MKLKKLILVFSSMLLLSCTNAVSSSDKNDESTPSSVLESKNSEENGKTSSEDKSDSLEASSSKEEAKEHTLDVLDFPKNEAGKYPSDQEIETSSGDTYYISQAMQGEGSYEGYIQMKKGVSFFYSKFAYTGLISFDVLIKNGYNNQDFTGVPSVYYGSEENSSSQIGELTKVTNGDGLTYHYSTSVDGYFTLKNESSYALYLKNFLFN